MDLLKFDFTEYLFFKHFFSLFMAKTGLAFSGGGIRSAAFCSGVLRRLLQKNVKIDYLSCVSGGGYTGTAYLDWKYWNGKKDDNEWHEEFFNHMRQSAGFICHCNKPLCIACASFILQGIFSKWKHLFSLFFHLSAGFFALVFFPWFIKEFFHRAPTWIKFLVFIPLFFLWISFPPIRSTTTIMSFTYLTSFVIYWRVYNESVFGFEYKVVTFDILLGVAAILHWISPWIFTVQQRLVHIYLR